MNDLPLRPFKFERLKSNLKTPKVLNQNEFRTDLFGSCAFDWPLNHNTSTTKCGDTVGVVQHFVVGYYTQRWDQEHLREIEQHRKYTDVTKYTCTYINNYQRPADKGTLSTGGACCTSNSKPSIRMITTLGFLGHKGTCDKKIIVQWLDTRFGGCSVDNLHP